jgi:hypothetical protein
MRKVSTFNNRGSPKKLLLAALVVLLPALLLAACSPNQAAPTVLEQTTEPPTAVPPTEVLPTPTEALPVEATPTEVSEAAQPEPEASVDRQAILVAWQAGPHGDTYDLGKGPNTYCSRCHSPQNWDPAATTDLPPNCVTCKFATDEELRIASTMDFVEEEDWVGIGCDTCHPSEGNLVQAQISWFNPIAEEHEPINTPNELCVKCHATTQGVSATGGRGVEHEIELGGSAHLNWAGALPQDRRPQYCTECHDAHSLQPKDCVDCHEDVLTMDTHMKGFIEEHENVTCMACHDASGLEVGPSPSDPNGMWVTQLSSTSRSGEVTTEYVHSHSIQWQVDCSRCHFEDNPWELEVLTPEGQAPEPASN